ncbi:MAG TPA: hypothetical protein VGC21_05095 [Telluria sp.]|jgi:hypothetical protein
MTFRRFPAELTDDPNKVLDAVMKKLNLKSDASLARVLAVIPPVISKIRHRTLPIGATILLRMHEENELSIRDLKSLMGVTIIPFDAAG